MAKFRIIELDLDAAVLFGKIVKCSPKSIFTNMETKTAFWESDSDQFESDKLAYVNGVDNSNILRNFLKKQPIKPKPANKTSNQHAKRKSKSAEALPLSNTTNNHANTTMAKEELNSLQSSNRTACLKDLRPEDKSRIAELIKELARVGESKEKAHQMLENERNYFTEQINQLMSQKESILKDRKNIMVEYKECQQLLSQYQKQITSQQEKLASDINKLLTPRPKTSEKKKSFFEALKDEIKASRTDDEKPINEEVIVKGLDEDLTSLDLTELLDNPVCKTNILKRNELLTKKKEALLKEQKRLQKILEEQQVMDLQKGQISTGSEKGTQITPPPAITPIKHTMTASPSSLFYANDFSMQPSQFATPPMINSNEEMFLKLEPISSKPKEDLGMKFMTVGMIAQRNESQEHLGRQNAISQLSCAQATVSSQSKHKTESTIPIEDDESMDELVDTLNNSTLSVTLKKSSSDSGHHSLNKTPPKNPRVRLQFTNQISSTTLHEQSPTPSILVDPEVDDSKLLEEIFFIK